MTMMIINKDRLLQICNIMLGEGKDENGVDISLCEDMIIEIKNKIIIVKGIDKLSIVFIKITLPLSESEQGEIPIGNIREFRDYINRFSDNKLTIQIQDNNLFIFGKEKKACIPLSRLDVIESIKNANTTDQKLYQENGNWRTQKRVFETKIVCNVDEIKEIFGDSEVVKYRKYPFRIDNNLLFVKVGTDNLGYIETQINGKGEGNCKNLYARGVEGVFKNLSGNVTLNMSENYPLIITSESPDINVFVSIAPIVEE